MFRWLRGNLLLWLFVWVCVGLYLVSVSRAAKPFGFLAWCALFGSLVMNVRRWSPFVTDERQHADVRDHTVLMMIASVAIGGVMAVVILIVREQWLLRQ